ncbi:S49 family peptidase [Microbacterium hominis]|uniref:SDH family Clp fold serine proteinase n=1 Tax=Microbacterium hominis TaxID=162426 RepID=UPI00168B95CB|nr:S49 family peptidase [Microbacterium hominis]QOC24734.1 S49 family peptidase [Microbacterium hominis]QOC28790.1 S49 family peptidase [Microbacterium hominis]
MRRDYLAQLAAHTGRNVIIYYSGWLEKQNLLVQGMQGFEIHDGDKTGFMSAVFGLDRSLGLDLILHTPGGDIAATESLVDYLRAMFNGDIRVIVPQLAMSCGTMIALSAKEVVMGKHSSLGPIDPQIGGIPAHGVIEEFNTAKAEIAADPTTMAVWQPIINKYNPTLVGEAAKAITWSKAIVKQWLVTGMFSTHADPDADADRVIDELADHALTLSHGRHISAAKAVALGIKVVPLEDDPVMQDLVLAIHHSCTQTLTETAAFKIIENQAGTAVIGVVNVQRSS